MKKLLAVLATTFAMAGCAGDSSGGGTPVRDISPSDYVTLSRTACFGACPVYDITLQGDGRVTYHGGRFTKLQGQHNDTYSAGRFLEVLSMFEMRGFSDFDDAYTRDTCRPWATDHPTVTVELKSADLTKKLVWYTGCRGIEERAQLDGMVDELERILDVERFIGTPEERKPKRR
ncbi:MULTISPECIES: DUF6438 domain-containing protein [Kordiimonas]|jgi:hypothetical protein|uniref:DUF6438 domain-containing protein n=1 Tax=Kordiimonas TaxID=288021 RepID=UPI002579686E|nr:DUF6438 domain-containing protein [Kordiimonas sp. UBA4487]